MDSEVGLKVASIACTAVAPAASTLWDSKN